MMRPDGSLILGRCQEPRELIQLPVDLREVDEYEKRIRLAERKPQAKRVVEVCGKARKLSKFSPQIFQLVIEDNFDFHKYAGSWKK